MDDPTQFGAEIAALTITRLKAIGLSIEEASSRRERLDRAGASACRSIALGRQAQITGGMTPVDADNWSKSAFAAFNSTMEAARLELYSDGTAKRANV